ncbi:hypothetical protein AMTRI_Chr04g189740 [Amborella trichopoda]
MADKPSRGLILYGDGLMPFLSPSHSHIHSLASRASCGFLALRDPPPTESEDDRVIRDLAQLLDVYDIYNIKDDDFINPSVDFLKQFPVPTISERFMGMRATLFTNCATTQSFGTKLGFNVKDFDELMKIGSDNLQSENIPSSLSSAARLLMLLGLEDRKVAETSEYDLVLLHVRRAGTATIKKENLNDELEWLNKLVGEITHIAEPGSPIASHLHLSLVLSYGSPLLNGDSSSLNSLALKEMHPNLSLLRPCQSYTMKGGRILNGIRHHHPMLVAQWQEAVTRKDMARLFSFQEFKERGGNLVILADRFLHEVAFKLWKAPKYGA